MRSVMAREGNSVHKQWRRALSRHASRRCPAMETRAASLAGSMPATGRSQFQGAVGGGAVGGGAVGGGAVGERSIVQN